MEAPLQRSRPRFIAYAFLTALAFLATLVSAVSMRLHIPRNDFYCYYRAAERFWASLPVYQNEVDLPYKYPPVTILYWLLLPLFSVDVSRWIFVGLHFLALSAIPLLIIKTIRPKAVFSQSTLLATLLGFVASLRFFENEFRSGQVGIFILFLICLSAFILSDSRRKPYPRILLGISVLTLGAVVKFHSLLVFLLFFRKQPWRDALLALGVVTLLLCLPYPSLWAAWIEQVRVTTPYAAIVKGQYVAQGIYPFAVYYFDAKSDSIWPMLGILPFLAYAALSLPRFQLREVAEKPGAFLTALLALVLLGVFASPLPWVHSYTALFAVIIVCWLNATRNEKRLLLLWVALMALSPSGIIGTPAARWLEVRQSLFLLCLPLWFILIRQSRRLFASPRVLDIG